jgi:4a-hydroxytetrahydrobiopterin dehydratase
MERRRLSTDEIHEEIREMPDWTVDGNSLKKSRKFANFAESLEFVNKVGSLAEEADHHPDISFGWGYADIALTTHDRGGITDVDIALAKRIEDI